MSAINYYWQISKYKNDELPLSGKGSSPTWSSVSDIGNTYNGNTFLKSDYLTVEELFIKAIQAFMNCTNSNKLIVNQLEKTLKLDLIEASLLKARFSLEESKEMLEFFKEVEKGMTIGLSEVKLITQLALREYVWTQLQSDSLFVRFDYDYFVDIGSTIQCEEAVKQVREMNLSINLWDDPYPFKIEL
ncbi:hypothetical protein [Metabacillus niabensis]|uniref:Uncharacterized protein n=1 Tax=Metabacillus niabensis TaxID=324854 RepID=A0ABT9YYM4_9BACI|nr:hypothetical protein [Metabacillus niabensis]MDQ0224433.1 hypothetical protein [Metabacillus niabensis]